MLVSTSTQNKQNKKDNILIWGKQRKISTNWWWNTTVKEASFLLPIAKQAYYVIPPNNSETFIKTFHDLLQLLKELKFQ